MLAAGLCWRLKESKAFDSLVKKKKSKVLKDKYFFSGGQNTDQSIFIVKQCVSLVLILTG